MRRLLTTILLTFWAMPGHAAMPGETQRGEDPGVRDPRAPARQGATPDWQAQDDGHTPAPGMGREGVPMPMPMLPGGGFEELSPYGRP